MKQASAICILANYRRRKEGATQKASIQLHEFELPSVRLARAEAAISSYLEMPFTTSSPLALCQRKHVADTLKNVATIQINRKGKTSKLRYPLDVRRSEGRAKCKTSCFWIPKGFHRVFRSPTNLHPSSNSGHVSQRQPCSEAIDSQQVPGMHRLYVRG